MYMIEAIRMKVESPKSPHSFNVGTCAGGGSGTNSPLRSKGRRIEFRLDISTPTKRTSHIPGSMLSTLYSAILGSSVVVSSLNSSHSLSPDGLKFWYELPNGSITKY